MKWALTLWFILLVVVFVASITPNMAPPSRYHADKIAHLLVYMLVSIPPLYILKNLWARVMAVLVMVAMGGIVERIQSHTPGREASMEDMAMNVLGIILGGIVAYVLRRRYKP